MAYLLCDLTHIFKMKLDERYWDRLLKQTIWSDGGLDGREPQAEVPVPAFPSVALTSPWIPEAREPGLRSYTQALGIHWEDTLHLLGNVVANLWPCLVGPKFKRAIPSTMLPVLLFPSDVPRA